MTTISGFPYTELQFTKDGTVFSQAELLALDSMLHDGAITDLLVISHGWNNDMDDARNLYKALLGKIAKASAEVDKAKKIGVLAIFWPSKKFAEKELIAGGAASVGASFNDADKTRLLTALDNLEGFFDSDEADEHISRAKKLVGAMENDRQAAASFVQQMNLLFSKGINATDVQPEEDTIRSFAEVNPADLLVRLEDDGFADPDADGGSKQGAASISGSGQAAGMNLSFGNVFGAAKNLLNFVTYYQMKERAGKVGLTGLYPVLEHLRQNFSSLKLHLIGHSFGGRLVTAATAGPAGSTFKADSLILLQAAFSHYGFASKFDGEKDGFFRSVVSGKKVDGVIMITFTRNDSAVGIAYALASRIAMQIGSGLGEKDDKFGGIGGNGAVSTPEANNNFHLANGITYAFAKGNLYNLNGDGCITGHSDICKDEVGEAIVAAINVAR